MNKKFIALFVIFLVAVLAIGSVSAANLSNHDFEGYFSMKVPKNVNFQKNVNSSEINGVKMDMLIYTSDNLVIMYMGTPLLSNESANGFYQSMFDMANQDLARCYESQEGNLTIIEPVVKDNYHGSLVGTSSGNKVIILFGLDGNLLKEMGRSIKFK